MNLRRWLGAIVILAVVAGAAFVAQETEPAGAKMALAAARFLEGLDNQQKERAAFPFDSPNRTKWYFTPQQDAKKEPTRKGLPLKSLNESQRKAALDILAAGTSHNGKEKAMAVMSLESILHELEKGAGPGRDPDWYFLSVFGKPGPTGKWSWRLEGHHLSLNFTIENGIVVGATPCFYGANPREVLAGDRKGFRALRREEDLARQLVKSLNPEQTKSAIISEKVPSGDIGEGNAQPALDRPPQGLAAERLTADQRSILLTLLGEYTGNLATDVGGQLMKELTAAGIAKIHFAWWGGTEPRQPAVYRVQGPTFILEFVNAQNQANHIHSCWRSLKGDFGMIAGK